MTDRRQDFRWPSFPVLLLAGYFVAHTAFDLYIMYQNAMHPMTFLEQVPVQRKP